MGIGKRSRLKGSGLLRNRNLFQRVPSQQGRCVSSRCRAVAAQAERYRRLNEELVRENAALRAAEKSNREFSVMFDRFLLKMGQSIPYVQGMKKHLELAYDNLGQIETMVDCFTDANSLRKFLIGDESFMFEPVQSDAKDTPRSPVVKQAPSREHRRFDEEGEIETILEQSTENVENMSTNSPRRERSTFVKAPLQCMETPAVPQRRSSRRSSIGIPRANMERTQNKTSLETPAVRTSTNSTASSKSSDTDSFEKRSELWQAKPSDLNPKSPVKRTTYVKVPQVPQILVSEAAPNRKTITVQADRGKTLEQEDLVVPIPGKSEAELSLGFEWTRSEEVTGKLPNIELPVIQERSPTAINVAQIWANANAAQRRSPTANIAALMLEPPIPELSASTSSATSPLASSLLDPMATTMFPSPILCEKESGLPTSTPAVNKAQNQPMTTPEVSIIAAGSPTMAPECAVIAAESPVQEPTVVKNVDCRRRKPNLLKGRQSSPQFSSAMRKSVRFSTVLDDSDLGERTTTKANVAAKASVSSPFVKRVRNTRVRQTKPAEIELSSEEEPGTPKTVERTEERDASYQPQGRKTYVKKKVSAATAGRKRSQRQTPKAEARQGPEQQSNDVDGNSTLKGDGLEPPSPKRVRTTSGTYGSARETTTRGSIQRPSTSRTPREVSSSSVDETLVEKRRSRRTPGISYAEPSLRIKMRREF